MRKRALVVVLLTAAVAVAGANAATTRDQLTIPISDTFEAPFLAAACGVPVTITIDGVAHVSLERNDAGLVVREHDVLASFTAVFRSPVELGGTGREFTNRAPSVVTYDYGDGAAIGSTATITAVGLQGAAAGPGSDVTAGYQRLTGTVFAFSPEGIPLVDWDGPVTAEHGLWPSFLDVGLAQRCSALGA